MKRCTAHENHGRILLAFVSACVVSKNPKTLNLSPMADDAITWGGIRGLGSPLYICGYNALYIINYPVYLCVVFAAREA